LNSCATKGFFIFGQKDACIFGLFFSRYKYGQKIATALTQVTHGGPRGLVNCSPHVQLQSALGTNVGGLGRVRLTLKSRLSLHVLSFCIVL